ncbi:hypothetical protein QZH41_002799 [Actinostola sp. cb2023]|nr:hypothetical protein QZH41_002799 [Actinostola sp. cb2023]
MVNKSDVDPLRVSFKDGEYWQPDLDNMTEHEPYQENTTPIFTVEHSADDPRYVKLRITKEWKEYRPRYKDSTFLNQTFQIPSSNRYIFGELLDDTMIDEVHGPVRKQKSKNLTNFEVDNTGVYKYPQAWPEPAMEWLVRPRPGSWPSPELLQDVFESGCHIAPVGRGTREQDPMDLLQYVADPTEASTSKQNPDSPGESSSSMDETEWRLSFSVAENKLGQSVTPVQRHIIVLLKILKKLYFPDVISSYHLKNLLFWEIEKQEESFWREDNSAKCLVYMLDRLQKCLEDGCLPHYVVPESNLLQYEETRKLDESAALIRDVRKNILPKTLSMFKRIISLTYQTPLYLQGLDWESPFSKLQDWNLSMKEAEELNCSLLNMFAVRCKDVIAMMLHSIKTEDLKEDIIKFMHVPLNAYKSLLARCLCKLFFHNSARGNITESGKDDFAVFVKEKVGDISSDEEFLALSLVFFEQARNGKDLSELAPRCTSDMERTKQIYALQARQQVEEAKAPLQKEFGWLHSSDLKEISKRVFTKLTDGGISFENLTIETIKSEMMKEFGLLRSADHADHDQDHKQDHDHDHDQEQDHAGHDHDNNHDQEQDHADHDHDNNHDQEQDHAGHDHDNNYDQEQDHAGHDHDNNHDQEQDHTGHDHDNNHDQEQDHTGHDHDNNHDQEQDHAGHDHDNDNDHDHDHDLGCGSSTSLNQS